MHVCTCVCMCAHVCTCKYMCVYMCMHVCACVCMCVHVSTCACMYMLYVCTCVCMCVCVHVSVYNKVTHKINLLIVKKISICVCVWMDVFACVCVQYMCVYVLCVTSIMCLLIHLYHSYHIPKEALELEKSKLKEFFTTGEGSSAPPTSLYFQALGRL